MQTEQQQFLLYRTAPGSTVRMGHVRKTDTDENEKNSVKTNGGIDRMNEIQVLPSNFHFHYVNLISHSWRWHWMKPTWLANSWEKNQLFIPSCHHLSWQKCEGVFVCFCFSKESWCFFQWQTETPQLDPELQICWDSTVTFTAAGRKANPVHVHPIVCQCRLMFVLLEYGEKNQTFVWIQTARPSCSG